LRLKHLKSLLFIIPVLLLSSCSDDPTSVGLDLLSGDLVNVKDYDSQSDTIKQTSTIFIGDTTTIYASRILIGQVPGEGNLKAQTMFTFSYGLADSLYSGIKDGSVKVIKAYLTMTPIYYYPTQTEASNMKFSVKRITALWYPYNIRNENVESLLTIDPTDMVISSSTTLDPSDSTCHVELNPTSVNDMLHNTTDTTYSLRDYGLVLQPTSGNGVVGFYSTTGSTTYPPRLTFILEHTNSYVYEDTVTVSAYADLHTVSGSIPSNLQNQNEYMAVRGGQTLNTKLTFDLSKIPSNAIINKAQLELKYVSSLSHVADTNNYTFYGSLIGKDSADQASWNYYWKTLTKSGDYYTGDITQFIQHWLTASNNLGMRIFQADELDGVDLFVLKGSKAASIYDRPRLKITYTTKK